MLGGLTLSLRGVLPGSSNRLVNSGAVWVVGAFVAEGGYLLVSHRPIGEVLILLAIGLLVPVVLGHSTRESLYGVAALAPVAAIGLGGYAVLNAFLDVAFTRGG